MPVAPYAQDILNRVVNVNWGGGLAVEFVSKSYLNYGKDVPLSKAVISLWFRAASSALDKAFEEWSQASNDDDPNSDAVLSGVVPIITWGSTTVAKSDSLTGASAQAHKSGPSFIGFQMVGGSDGERTSPHLVIRFQSQNDSTLHIPHDEGLRLVSGMGNFYAIGNQASMHSYFPSDPKDIDLVEDKWNHLLLSFEATGPQGRLWLAVNDKNYSGQHLYPACPSNMEGVGGDENDIIATFDWPIYSKSPYVVSSGGFEMPTGNFGTPFCGEFVDNSKEPVMLAELQVFTGSTLDTNDVDNRRAFVSANGKPVPADQKAGIDGAGNVIPKGSIQLMGRRPDIMLHGSSDWIKGRNTGSSGIDGEGHVLPDGQFTPDGQIVKYSPDPSLPPVTP